MADDGFMPAAYALTHRRVNTFACLPRAMLVHDHANVNKLAANLKSLLGEMSENQLAEATGVPQPTINRILRGESRDPRDSTLVPIARYFGVSVEALRRGTSEPAPATAPTLTPDEQAILDLWRALDSDGRRAVQAVGHALAKPLKGRGKVQGR